jgi:endonuclease III
MVTRAAAKREAEFLGQEIDEEPVLVEQSIVSPVAKRNPRKRKANAVNGATINGEVVKGGWDELPHNLGTVAAADNTAESPSLPITPPDSVPRKKARTSRAKKNAQDVVAIKDEKTATPDLEIKQEESLGSTGQEGAQNKPKAARRRAPKKKSEETKALVETKTAVIEQNELTNGVKPEDAEDNKVAPKRKRKAAATKTGPPAKRVKLLEVDSANDADVEDQKSKRTRAQRVAKKVDTSQAVQDQVDKLIEGNEILKKAKKLKKHKYGLTPGVTPYQDFLMPTPEACLEVKNLLSGLHGVVEQPKAVPPPSLEVTGCGEVPSVLDALIRTRLSAATTSTNSSYAFAGLVSKFGILKEGIGKGSVNWNKVREADVKEVEAAIKRGGLGKSKSIDIKKILDMVHDENMARREAFLKEKESGEKANVVGGESFKQGQKDMEIAVADKEILSLQYMHGLTPDEAMEEFIKYPGIGVKTASCVILFCLRRPSFAVDTHIYRLCRWLKWIPEKATRDSAFSHCEVRIPNEYKYSLHQLFIRHGRTCGRCRASTSETSEAWKETVCPIDHLVERTGLRKILKPAGKMKKKKNTSEEDIDSELSELDEAIFDGHAWNETETTPGVGEEK